MAAVEVRDATTGDAAAIARIFNELIPTTTITWSDRPDSDDDRRAWIRRQHDDGYPVLVATVDGDVVGFAAYGEFRDVRRWPGYRHTAELSIHVGERHHRRGVGRALIDELLRRARSNGIHVMVAGIDGDNDASILFHERMGFRIVGRLPQIGRKFDRWLDLVLMQRELDDTAPGAAG